MPNRALRPCTYPGCHTLVEHGSRCASHARLSDQQRGTSTQRGYGYAWRKKRAAFLQKHPWCCDLFGIHGEGNVPATQVDHKLPKRLGGKDDEENLEGFCDSCHSRKTATDDGGFGNAAREGGRNVLNPSKVNRASPLCVKISPIETD